VFWTAGIAGTALELISGQGATFLGVRPIAKILVSLELGEKNAGSCPQNIEGKGVSHKIFRNKDLAALARTVCGLRQKLLTAKIAEKYR
jgi:hypothetical protein